VSPFAFLPYQETSFSNAAATTVVNQDQDVYNGLGQLTGEYQSVSGAVNTGTTPEVQYAYSDPSLGSRQTSMTYPNGRVVDDVYNTGIDTTIGRVSALADAGGSAAGNLQGYVYQGLATIVGYIDGNGVTETTTLDGFGRTAEMDYVNSSGTSTDNFAYGYDRDNNVLYKDNLLNSAQSELSHANSTATGDDNAAYDPLNRLTGFARGTLSASGNNGTTLDTVASASASQSWNLNAVGDQSSVTTNGTTTTNSTNAKNELTANGGSSLTYDNNGNTLTDENGQSYTYSAWNQQVTVKNAAGTVTAAYGNDAQGRRVTEGNGTTTTAVYFSNQWQAIEQRVGGTVTLQNVWGEGFVNQLVERDDNSTSGSLGITGSGLGERLYAQQDLNWSETSLVDTSGNVVQRMDYSAYGVVTFLTPSWSPTTDGYAQNVLFQGGRLETATGNYDFQRRDYDPVTGSWKEVDPKVYVNGADRYQMEVSSPCARYDPTGLSAGATSPFLPDPNQRPEGWDPSWPTGTDNRGPYVQNPNTGVKWYPHPEDKGHWPHYDDENGNRYPQNCKKPWPGQRRKPYGDQSPVNPWPAAPAPDDAPEPGIDPQTQQKIIDQTRNASLAGSATLIIVAILLSPVGI
jgi:RHS repeat-associated protein